MKQFNSIFLKLKVAVGGHEALPVLVSNPVFQLLVHSLGISGFELDPHYCQLPVAEEVLQRCLWSFIFQISLVFSFPSFLPSRSDIVLEIYVYSYPHAVPDFYDFKCCRYFAVLLSAALCRAMIMCQNFQIISLRYEF